MQQYKRILISRIDAIGDVMLTMPMCGLIKRYFPDTEIYFLGRRYTLPVLLHCTDISAVLNYDEWNTDDVAIKQLKELKFDAVIHVFPNKRIARIMQKAGIPIRVGTSRRWYHWLYANRRVYVKRKNSPLHEAQLNIQLLKALGIDEVPAISELYRLIAFNVKKKIPNELALPDLSKKKIIILHPKSAGSSREWPLKSYAELIQLLNPDQFQIIICGTTKEKGYIIEWLKTLPAHVFNAMGLLTLENYIELIASSYALVAASTGPIHIAAACGVKAIGIYPPIKPMHPERWKPLGVQATYLVGSKSNCTRCRTEPVVCTCMNEINAQQVYKLIQQEII